jgi:hypothetical protein
LFGDIAWSFNVHGKQFEALTQKYLYEYEQLFFGNNLKPLRKYYAKHNPKWNQNNVSNIAKIMNAGMKLVKTKLRHITL